MENAHEYASKGVAGAGLGLGIAGTALGVLNNGGLNLGGLLGGNNMAGGMALGVIAEKDAKIAQLEAEKYSDKVAKETYIQAAADNKELRDEMFSFLKPLSEEASNNRVTIAELKAEIECLKKTGELDKQIVFGKINEVALVANNGITALNGAIACLQKTVAGITATVVPIASVCPQPMPQYNSWTAPTTTTTTTPAA